jgi:ubiquinone/menaquinone biosynthesis C-methylase UbiE
MIDYTVAAETYDHTRSHSDEVIDRFYAVAPLGASHAVLDFGCGTGNYLFRIHQRFGCRCCGVEPSDAMRARASSKSSQIEVVKGDHRTVPFPSETFDFSFMTDVIHHVPDLRSMFGELQRVLKNGGHLCVVTESHAQIEGRFYNRYFPSLATVEKSRYPHIEEVIARAADVGLELIATDTASAPPRQVTETFLRHVAEKNWSMFRLLSESEFVAGLGALARDAGKSFASPTAGETFVWFRKAVQPLGAVSGQS